MKKYFIVEMDGTLYGYYMNPIQRLIKANNRKEAFEKAFADYYKYNQKIKIKSLKMTIIGEIETKKPLKSLVVVAD